MAKKFRSGKRGKVKLNIRGSAVVELEITNWSCNLETELLDASTTGTDGKRKYVSGLTGGSGSFEGFVDLNQPLTQQFSDIEEGDEITLELYLGDEAIDNKKISGTAMVSSVEYTSEINGIVSFSCSFSFQDDIVSP